MADKTCSNCGATVPAAAQFCTQCGSRDLIEAAAPPPPEPTAPAVPGPITPDAPTTPVGDTSAPSPTGPTAPFDPTATFPAPPPAADPPPVGAPAPQPPPPTMTDVPTAAMPAPAAVTSPAPTPEPVAPSAPPRASGGGRFGAVIALIGGAVAIVGAFLDWMTLTPDLGDAVSLTGWSLSDDAKIIVALGGVGVVAAVVVLAGTGRGILRLVTVAVGIAAVAIGGYDTWDILQRLPDELSDLGVSGVEISAPDLGLILVLAGGVVLILGALGMTAPEGSKTAGPDTGVGEPSGASTAPSGGYVPPAGGYTPPSGGYAPPPQETTIQTPNPGGFAPPYQSGGGPSTGQNPPGPPGW